MAKREVATGAPKRALVAARAGKLTETLEALVATWRAAPAPELAASIATLSAAVRTTPEGLHEGGVWDELAARATVADLPALLETVLDGYPVHSLDRLARLPIDPRVDRALVELVETLHERPALPRGIRRDHAEPFWLAVLARLRRLRDPALIARLAAAKLERDATLLVVVRRQRRILLATLAKAKRPPAPPRELGELARLIAAATSGRHDLAALEASVYANPDDDGTRLVYADALLERGDKRGELIALQCVVDPSDAQRARVSELLAAHGQRWLGPLGTVVLPGYRFERGFLAACAVDTGKFARLDALAGHPMWATVRELVGGDVLAIEPVMRGLRVLDFASATWPHLLLGEPRAIEVLRYHGPRIDRAWSGNTYVPVVAEDELAALCTCAALPHLRVLTLVGGVAPCLDVLRKAPVLRRLDTLALECHEVFGVQATMSSFARLIAAAPVPQLGIALRFAWHLVGVTLERAGRRYVRAAVTIAPPENRYGHDGVTEACAMVADLPASVTELRCDVHAGAEQIHAAFDARPVAAGATEIPPRRSPRDRGTRRRGRTPAGAP